VHGIKIDRSFIAGVGRNPDDEVIVSSLISLATTLGLQIFAEGIETDDQLRMLRRLGCEIAQGYLWSKAVPASQLPPVIIEIERRPIADRPAPPHLTSHVDPVVRSRVLSMHRQGASPASIASALNADAVPSPSGKRWHRVTVARLVQTHSD
jgi:hypothetical protein